MSSITEMTMECKKNVRIDFTGGELSSDGGLLLLKAFADKIGLTKLVGQIFHTVDTAAFRIHTDSSNLMQTVFLIIAVTIQSRGKRSAESFHNIHNYATNE